jgi:hypothetical protein
VEKPAVIALFAGKKERRKKIAKKSDGYAITSAIPLCDDEKN